MAKSKKSLKPKKLTSFPMFKELVPELREMIWGFVPEANTVKISLYKIEEYDSKGELFFLETMDARYTVPAILHTCQESRGVAQKFYQKIFELKFRDRPVWFNTSRDILHLCNTGTLRGIGIRRLNGQGDNKEWHEHNNDPDDDEEFIIHAFDHPIPQIRRLQLGWDLDDHLRSSMKEILVAFGKPELLILHKRNDRRKFQNQNFSRLKQEVEAYWGNGGDGNDDYKPELHVLTKYQLERMIKKIDHPPRPKKAKASKLALSTTRRSDRFVERPLSYYEGGEEVGDDVRSDNESVGEADDNGDEGNSGNHDG